jgi:hypothetical protein
MAKRRASKRRKSNQPKRKRTKAKSAARKSSRSVKLQVRRKKKPTKKIKPLGARLAEKVRPSRVIGEPP